jgi:hypothetical protein
MNILQFKVGGKYDYNVSFETNTDTQKLQTNDQPTGNLLSAISQTVVAAIKFFRFENITAQFRQILFSYPETGPNTFSLEFAIKTKENVYVKHVLKTDKIPLASDDTSSTDINYQLRVEQGNSLIEKVQKLHQEIVNYVQGERAQSDLPFEDGNERKTDEDDLFGDDDDDNNELDIVPGNIAEITSGEDL